MNKKELLKSILFDKSNNFIKRLVTLAIAFHFVASSFFYLIVYPFILFSASKGDIEIIRVITDAFLFILDKDFWIICVGFGFLTTKDFATAMVQKAMAKAGGPVDVIKTDSANVEKAETVNSQNINIEQVH